MAGGGAKNAVSDGDVAGWVCEPLGVKVRLMEELGVPAQAKEAVAFALLAWLTWNGLPGNVPAATGAERAVVLGKVSSWVTALVLPRVLVAPSALGNFLGRLPRPTSPSQQAGSERFRPRLDIALALLVIGCMGQAVDWVPWGGAGAGDGGGDY